MFLNHLLAAASGDPNWALIIGIIVVFLAAAAVLLIPSKKKPAIEEEKKKELPKADSTEDKTPQTLSEIKEAKHAAVSEGMSKDEMRELRKERRAAAQTEKAIHGREEAEKQKEAAEAEAAHDETADSAHAETADADETQNETAVEENSKTAEDSQENAKDIDKITAPIDDIVTKSDADTGDVFESLFGSADTKKSDALGMDLDSLFGDSKTEANAETESASFFPTLGSKLIPLSEIKMAENESAQKGLDPLDELTKRLAEKAEKKTLV